MLARVTITVLFVASVLSPMLLLPSSVSAQEKTNTAESFIEIRYARQTAAPGYQEMTAPNSTGSVYVSSENAFTDTDFADVGTRRMQSGIVLRTWWKLEAAERWAEIRRGEADSGFLAVFINGELVSAPRIAEDPLYTARSDVPVDIGVQVSAEKADSIADAISVRWPGGAGG